MKLLAVIPAVSLGFAAPSLAEGWVLDGRHLSPVSENVGTTFYDPNSPAAVQRLCEERLQYAEQMVAKALSDFNVELTLSAQGVAGGFEGINCQLTSKRNVELTIEGTKD